MRLYQIDEETFEICPQTGDAFTVKVDYRFMQDEHLRLEWFSALLENGQPANLDDETESELIRAVELDYVNYLVDRD